MASRSFATCNSCFSSLDCPPHRLPALPPLQRVVFEGPKAERQWALKELNPQLTSDCTRYQYLVVKDFRRIQHERLSNLG